MKRDRDTIHDIAAVITGQFPPGCLWTTGIRQSEAFAMACMDFSRYILSPAR